MFALIMAGGSGKRFWPFSRFSVPKQFLNITGEKSMLEETLCRLDGLISPDKRLIVINKEHTIHLENMPPGSCVILKEPVGRNTAPCVGLGALYFYTIDPDTPVAVLPADHYIPDGKAFRETLEKTFSLAREGYIVTIGIVPTRPETGYGYIHRGESVSPHAFRVKRFVEKPDLHKALEYLKCGDYFWNAGMFIFTPRVMLEEISLLLPELYSDLESIKKHINTDSFDNILEEVYPHMTSVSIDYGVMEKTRRPVAVVPAGFEWSDIGSWQSLFELKASCADSSGNVLEGPGVLVDTKNSFICNKTDTMMAVLGMENLLAVSTKDAILIAKLEESQRVQEIIEILKKKHLEDYL